MAIIISVCNRKGGVGKTTSCINIGAGLALKGYKVLLIDFDPQGSMTKSLIQTSGYSYIGDWLLDRAKFNDVLQQTEFGNFHFVPSSADLQSDEMDMQKDIISDGDFLGNKLQEIESQYDFILIDTAPAFGLLFKNALLASHSVLIPAKPDFNSSGGLADLVGIIDKVKRKKNLEILGVFVTIYRAVPEYDAYYEKLKSYFPGRFFDTKIRINLALEKAASRGKPIQHFDNTSSGAIDYNKLCEEIIIRCNLKQTQIA